MKTYALPLLAATASAFPSVLQHVQEQQLKNSNEVRQARPAPLFRLTPPQNATAQASWDQKNCGVIPCLVFNADEQRVSTTGDHRFTPPSSTDLRGPCPGLNAAANHGYLPRNGIAHIGDTIQGLFQLYGMSPDLSGFLAAYAIAITGDPLTEAWSIGGPLPQGLIPILGRGQGIGRSHNKYEGDTSITRNDAYLNNGDAFSVNIRRFIQSVDSARDNKITLDGFRQLHGEHVLESIRTNPNYFAPLFSTTLVAPAAHNFVINFMSNRSAENPNGELTVENYKMFWSVTGDYPNYKWTPGNERVPDNFYRRTGTNPYTVPNVFDDLLVGFAAYPGNFRLGGNTNGVNTYQGIDLATFTSGGLQPGNIFQGNNFQCLIYQSVQQAVPDGLLGQAGLLTKVMELLSSTIAPAFAGFGCPNLYKLDRDQENRFPGSRT